MIKIKKSGRGCAIQHDINIRKDGVGFIIP